ncbi:hypothetical protein PR002_g15740 [Phytophthora rubi]|uniref:Uncharacterized protein n=1 Tax=Phytophthora rubi TaxID=129364 RepID=A0A6A3KP96_9STRA|nr:hypothetical protein PR002_g15740 [Phytophthora rubi]
MQFTWGFLDGKNYRVQQPPNPDVQNAHFNGWNDGDTSLDFRRILADLDLNPDTSEDHVSRDHLHPAIC